MTHDDEKQLRLLSQLHYVAAALAAVIPLLGAIYGAIGVGFLLGKLPGMPPTAGRAFGWMPLALGLFILLIGAATVCANILTARSLSSRKRHTLCLLTAMMNCVHFPLGTLLGAFTILVLSRSSVKAAFECEPNLEPPGVPGVEH